MDDWKLKNGSWHYVVTSSINNEQESIQGYTVSEIMEFAKFEQIDLLKIDIKGQREKFLDLMSMTGFPKFRY